MPESKAQVKLKVDGYKERDVADVSYSFYQTTDKEGQPTGIPRGGKIVITAKALNDGNCELLNWMIEKSLAKNGLIEYMNHEGKKMKEVKFKGAYCVNFVEMWKDQTKYDAKEENGRDIVYTEQITITCKEISNQSVNYNNEWA